LMREMKEERKESRNVKIDIPESLNDPKFERSDLDFMTDEYKRMIGK
jgi:hypothetical protein